MKVLAIAVALFFALGSTLAVAQGVGRAGGAELAPVLVGQVAEPRVAQVLAQAQPAERAQPEQLERLARPVALPT
jgi:hypothetical protein